VERHAFAGTGKTADDDEAHGARKGIMTSG
jgi:hypothetical protein